MRCFCVCLGRHTYLYYQLFQQNQMSITQLVSEIRLKDTITFTLNSESLNRNFDVVKQCLLRIKDLEDHVGKSKESTTQLQSRIKVLEAKVEKHSEDIHSSQQRVKELSANVGDDFMKKIYGIEEKTRNMFDFDETVRRLQNMNKFVLIEQYNTHNNEVKQQFQRVWKLREDFDRYLLNSNFNKYKAEQSQLLATKDVLIDQCNQEISRLRDEIGKMNDTVLKVEQSMKENSAMIKEINFTELLDKIKKFREETEARVTELAAKIKKKVSQNEMLNLEKSMIEKLDKFLAENQRNKAQKQETKEALMFLQRKINDIEDIVIHRASDQEKDALFSSKKWQCASCTKDLGKYQGKLGQYKPWSIFPCKELDPQKTGGFGYLNYIDKMSYKRGFDSEESKDPNLQRLNKTFFDSKEKDHVKRLGTTRGSNLITNYGSEEKGSSLKDVYFKDSAERGNSTHRIFRVTRKQQAKPLENQAKESHSP